MAWTDAEARERVAQLEALLAGLEELPEPARARGLDAVAGLVEVYGEAFGRVLERVPGEVSDELASDELVGHLLMVHGMHPRSVEERVLSALDEVRPSLATHEGGVELLGIDGPTVRLRLEGTCHGCPSSTATLKLAVEEAILEAAPEIERVEAEGAVEEDAAIPGVALPIVQGGREAPGPCPAGSIGAAT
jgi:Fe-S cluster biogenesis protein NfuA